MSPRFFLTICSAGSRDSELTNHGVLQAQQLGQYLANSRPKLTHIFSSILRRAVKTATALKDAQTGCKNEVQDGPTAEEDCDVVSVMQVKELMEQDFGFYEGKPFYARPTGSSKTGKEAHQELHKDEPGFQDVESKESLAVRCDIYLDNHLIPLLDYDGTPDELCVAIVSHGILLSHLWRRLLLRLPRKSLTIAPEVVATKGQVVLEHLGGYSNTGFLELSIRHSLLEFPPLALGTASSVRAPTNSSDNAENAVIDIGVQVSESLLPLAESEIPTTVASGRPPRPTSPSESETGRSAVKNESVNAELDDSLHDAADTHAIPDELHVIDDTQPATRPTVDTPSSTVLMLEGFVTHILTVNGQDHIRGLKRTRGGIGSARHDEGQKSISSFFKRAKKA